MYRKLKMSSKPRTIEATVPATIYTRKASTDPIHGYTITFREIWLGPPYNICVNFASPGVMQSEQMNLFEQDKPTLTFCVSFRGKEEKATNVKQIQVSKNWADKCLQYITMKKTMIGVADMLQKSETFNLLHEKEHKEDTDEEDHIENDSVPFHSSDYDSTNRAVPLD